MLVYDWALDPNHTFLRILSVLKLLENKGFREIEYGRLRILDFILAKPEYISQFTFERSWDRSYRSKFKKLYTGYNSLNAPLFFSRMKGIFDSVIDLMEELKVLIRENGYSNYSYDSSNLPNKIETVLENNQSVNQDALLFIEDYLLDIELHGEKGLRGRSKLMDISYDNR